MNRTVNFQPRSLQIHWLLTLKPSPDARQSRIAFLFERLNRAHWQSRADHFVLLALHQWHQHIKKAEQYLDREIAWLSKLAGNKKGSATFAGNSKCNVVFKVSSPVAQRFFCLLCKCDKAMDLLEGCVALKRFRRLRIAHQKQKKYQYPLLQLMQQVNAFSFDTPDRPLTGQEEERLYYALRSEIAPLPETQQLKEGATT